MSYTLTPLDDGHILLCVLHSDLNLTVDLPQFLQESHDLVENGPDRIVTITDVTATPLQSIDDLLRGANYVRSPEVRRLTNHPKVIKYLVVVKSMAVQIAVKGLNTATFGFYQGAIFETQEEALAHARAILFDQS